MKKLLKLHISLMAAVVAVAAASSCAKPDNNGRSDSRDSLPVEEVRPPLVAFCDNIDYSDTAMLHDAREMGKAVATIVKLLHSSDSVTVRTALTGFFTGLRHDEAALSSAMRYADKYLNNPASPFRNDGAYIALLSTLLDLDSIPALERDLAEERLRIASLNRTGSQANDFRFEEPDGSRRSLYDIKSPMTLLIFYNPECSPCTKILAEIASNSMVNAAVRNGQLAVVAIYAEGKRDVWQDNVAEMPVDWTVGYDLSDILDNDIYDLPAMPTLYMLDADKRVLLKDPDHRLLSKFLRNNRQTATKK